MASWLVVIGLPLPLLFVLVVYFPIGLLMIAAFLAALLISGEQKRRRKARARQRQLEDVRVKVEAAKEEQRVKVEAAKEERKEERKVDAKRRARALQLRRDRIERKAMERQKHIEAASERFASLKAQYEQQGVTTL